MRFRELRRWIFDRWPIETFAALALETSGKSAVALRTARHLRR